MANSILFLIGVLHPNSFASDGAGVPAPDFRAVPLASPATAPSRLPHLATDAGGRIWLSWVAEQGDGHAPTKATLRLSCLRDEVWSDVGDVASGERWFVNWADYPSVVALDGELFVAHYLEKSGEGPYDYHVKLRRSADGGKTWGDPVRLHADSGPGEHGFVSIVPLADGAAAAVWLDGRASAGHGESAQSASTGAMRLYARGIAADGALGDEILLDERVCDCCPTAAVRAPDGALVVAYRDRSGDEVRDITVVRVEEGRVRRPGWSSSDRWKIAGCPVNGPALAVAGDRIGVAWFTIGTDGEGRVLCAFSKDGGRGFSSPLTLARGGVHGRVDAEFDRDGRFVVSWLEAELDRAQWRVARVTPEPAALLDVFTVAATETGRASGIARLARDDTGIVFAWTDPGKESHVGVRRLCWE